LSLVRGWESQFRLALSRIHHGKPGSGPGLHRHLYDEIQFIREGRRAIGESPLVQLDVHLSPRFIQENL
jgi:hypothetical protein